VTWFLIAAAALGAPAWFAVLVLVRRERACRSAGRDRAWQRELVDLLGATRSEREAQELLEGHVRRTVGNATVTYLEPHQACAAARIGREYRGGSDADPLLGCERCGAADTAVTCLPARAAGSSIGSLLVEHPGHLTEGQLAALREALAAAAPAFAHLKGLAAAQTGAALDALTGLPNSRSLQDALARLVAQAGRSVSPFSVVLLDLDHFRQLNDLYGHERGDDVLAAVGALLRDSIRASDYAGRYGGEEFLVLLPETDREGALLVADKLRHAVAATRVGGVDRPLSASFGVASLPADGGDGDSLVRRADRALFAAKAAGGNRVECAGLSVAPGPT
jgi:diguanylate cyclase (GGDEF)-like protein